MGKWARQLKANMVRPAMPPTAKPVLRAEVGQGLTEWVCGTAKLLGMTVVPGQHFVLTRDFLIYKHGSFLTTGLPAICATALFPYKAKKGPYLNYLMLEYGHVDSMAARHLDKLYSVGTYARIERAWIREVRNYVAKHYGQRGYGDYADYAEFQFNMCVEKNLMVPLGFQAAKKTRESLQTPAQDLPS